MFINFLPFFIGIVAGVHASSYGAYKDSPYEGFKLVRVIREIFIAGLIGLFFSVYFWAESSDFFVVFLVIFAASRCVTEFYKLFIRVEDQKLYKIPTQIHFFGKILNNRFQRLLIGIFSAVIIFGVYLLGEYLLSGLPVNIKGLILGFLIGLLTAAAGSYKDGFFEGFDLMKFFRSPTLGAIGGVLVSQYTNNTIFLVLGAVGFERVIVELYKAFLKKGYWPGKFGSGKVHQKEWLERRKIFIPIYFSTLIFLIYLFCISFFK